jgi:hypothetical protein
MERVGTTTEEPTRCHLAMVQLHGGLGSARRLFGAQLGQAYCDNRLRDDA